jgi:hypothetical protein
LRALLLPAFLTLVHGAAVAADLSSPPTLGRVSLGMSIEAALRATPDLAWENTVSPVTGRTLEITAKDGFTLDGYSYTVRLRPQAYRWSTLEVRGWQQGADRHACRRQVLALAAHLEPHFPNMGARSAAILPPPPSSGTIVAHTSPEGRVTVTGQPNMFPDIGSFRQSFVPVGTSGKVLETIVNEDRTTWEFERTNSESSPYSVRAFAFFDELALRPNAGLEDEPSQACVIEATLHARPKGRPDFDTLNFARQKPVAVPSRELLHDSLAGIDLPRGGVNLSFRCQVARIKGTLEQCHPVGDPDTTPFEMQLAAQARLHAYRFNPLELDPDSDVPLYAVIVVHSAPRPLAPSRSGERPPAQASSAASIQPTRSDAKLARL